MNPVIQEETTGCGIASVAAIVGTSYAEMKQQASEIGIFASDKSLWSDTTYVRKLLSLNDIETAKKEKPFTSWSSLPDTALLSIKHHQEEGIDYWHWVVFSRDEEGEAVLDSASYLESNVRTDFNEIQPKWYIEVKTS